MKEIKIEKRKYQLFGIILVILCLNSLFYHQIREADLDEDNDILDVLGSFPERRNDINEIGSIDTPDEEIPIPRSETLGNFKTKAFFPGGTGFLYGSARVGETLIHDPSGEDPFGRRNIMEWISYDDIKDDGTLNKEMYWRATQAFPVTWPNDTNWFYLRELGYPNEPSKIYSPVFTEEYEITGKVHYLSWITLNDTVAFNRSISIGYRLELYLFNPADPLNPTRLATRTSIYSISTSAGQRTHSDTLDLPNTIIPAGYRLRWDIRLRFSELPEEGSFMINSGFPWGGGGTTTWTINDGIYSNTYTINNVTRMAGIQVYMRSRAFPDINVLGATNNTVYQVNQNMTVDVTDGSISSYSWDGGSWIAFDNQTTITLPSGHGWHDLEVKASDPEFNNTKVVYYRFGYDASIDNLELNTPLNGSTIAGGTLIDLSAYSVSTVKYMWDNDGSWLILNNPYDLISPNFNGEHNLTINTTDFYTTDTYFYLFTFDSTAPNIVLYNVNNGSTHAPGKIIEVEITDNFGIQSAYYSWDSPPDDLWSPTQGDIYSTSLPAIDGNHYLYVSANDNFNYLTTVMYQFTTDSAQFLVELAELRNDSYYLGGEDVIINVQKSNGTIRYVWDSGTIKDGTIIAGQLSLTGVDALPSSEGTHNLTIITFDFPGNFLRIIYFNFTVDQTNPVIDNSILSYNNTRWKTDNPFTFLATDNYIISSDLIILISVDGKANQTLNYPYQLNLLTLDDGIHEFYLYAFDIAGNFDIKYITFIIDTTNPVIEVIIPKMEDFSLIDGNYYIPTNALVYVFITEDDPAITSYYTWNGSAPILFTDNFRLNYSDGSALLFIYANDSLGHFDTYSITLQ
jgi:hypothetical protein